MESPNRSLGVEGGGTKTDWVLFTSSKEGADEQTGGVLPGSNLQLTSDAQLLDLFAALPHPVTRAGIYLAGCATPEDHARLLRLAKASWPEAEVVVGNDRESSFATAFKRNDGILVIAGTGAVVHGRRGLCIEKAGGWGHVLGDRGSGYDLAQQGLRLVLANYDLDQTITPLAERILRELALNSLADLAAWAVAADKMSVARLAPAIFEAAKMGDAAMLRTITSGAHLLAELTSAVAHRLELAEPDVVLMGGLFTHHAEYVRLYQEQLAVFLPRAAVSVCPQTGAYGAWLLSQIDGQMFVGAKSSAAGNVRAEMAGATTELSNPRSANLETLAPVELVELFVNEESAVAAALAACQPVLAAAVELIGAALLAGGRLFYVGAGTSGRLGVLDASEIPPTFGAPPELVQGIMAGGVTALHRAVEGAEDQPLAGAHAIVARGVRAGDVACGITASGRTPFVLGALAQARTVGAQTLLLTCNPARPRAEEAWDVEIDLPTGPEIVTGSTRLKAGTATKVALNILSTGAMVRLGRVRGNAMIDLHISNEKLRDRGVRLVSEQLGIADDEARVRLERANWNVRAALAQR